MSEFNKPVPEHVMEVIKNATSDEVFAFMQNDFDIIGLRVGIEDWYQKQIAPWLPDEPFDIVATWENCQEFLNDYDYSGVAATHENLNVLLEKMLKDTRTLSQDDKTLNFTDKTKQSFKNMSALDELEANIASLLRDFYEEHDLSDKEFLSGKTIDDFSDYGYETGLIPEIRDFILADVSNQLGIICDKQNIDDDGFDIHKRTSEEEKGNCIWKSYCQNDAPLGMKDAQLQIFDQLSQESIQMDIENLSEAEREEVAKHGRPQDLDILVHDENKYVRLAVAGHGRPEDLDILVNDSGWEVRREVAAKGRPQDLDILVNDENQDVRAEVATKGRTADLDIFINDKSWAVRYEVAHHGRPEDLDILVNDENKYVRDIAQKTLNKQQSETSLDSEAKDMSAAKDAQDVPAAGHDKDKGVI